MAIEDVELDEIRDTLIRGKFADTLPRLRELLKRKIQQGTNYHRTTPTLNFDNESNSLAEADSLETLFAFALWEAEKNDYIAADIQLLEQSIMETTRGPLSFQLGAAWLVLKCRPGATKDELNDSQQLLDRYLLQVAREAPPSSAITNELRAKYAFLVELLTLRVLPALNQFESALSFLAEEHVRKDLLPESDRRRFLDLLKQISPRQTQPQTSVEAASSVAQPPLPNISSTSTAQSLIPRTPAPALGTQQMVEEFERRRRKAQEDEQLMMLKNVVISATATLIVGLVFSERKRITKILASLGDALFGE